MQYKLFSYWRPFKFSPSFLLLKLWMLFRCWKNINSTIQMLNFVASTRIRKFSLGIQHSACVSFSHLCKSINNIFLVHSIMNILTIAKDEDIKKFRVDPNKCWIRIHQNTCRALMINFQPLTYCVLSIYKAENLIIFTKGLRLGNHEIFNLRKTQVPENDTKLSGTIHLLEVERFCRGMWKGWIDGPRRMIP